MVVSSRRSSDGVSKKWPDCLVCGQRLEFSSAETCSTCKEAQYCSSKCRRVDENGSFLHEQECKRMPMHDMVLHRVARRAGDREITNLFFKDRGKCAVKLAALATPKKTSYATIALQWANFVENEDVAERCREIVNKLNVNEYKRSEENPVDRSPLPPPALILTKWQASKEEKYVDSDLPSWPAVVPTKLEDALKHPLQKRFEHFDNVHHECHVADNHDNTICDDVRTPRSSRLGSSFASEPHDAVSDIIPSRFFAPTSSRASSTSSTLSQSDDDDLPTRHSVPDGGIKALGSLRTYLKTMSQQAAHFSSDDEGDGPRRREPDREKRQLPWRDWKRGRQSVEPWPVGVPMKEGAQEPLVEKKGARKQSPPDSIVRFQDPSPPTDSPQSPNAVSEEPKDSKERSDTAKLKLGLMDITTFCNRLTNIAEHPLCCEPDNYCWRRRMRNHTNSYPMRPIIESLGKEIRVTWDIEKSTAVKFQGARCGSLKGEDEGAVMVSSKDASKEAANGLYIGPVPDGFLATPADKWTRMDGNADFKYSSKPPNDQWVLRHPQEDIELSSDVPAVGALPHECAWQDITVEQIDDALAWTYVLNATCKLDFTLTPNFEGVLFITDGETSNDEFDACWKCQIVAPFNLGEGHEEHLRDKVAMQEARVNRHTTGLRRIWTHESGPLERVVEYIKKGTEYIVPEDAKTSFKNKELYMLAGEAPNVSFHNVDIDQPTAKLRLGVIVNLASNLEVQLVVNGRHYPPYRSQKKIKSFRAGVLFATKFSGAELVIFSKDVVREPVESKVSISSAQRLCRGAKILAEDVDAFRENFGLVDRDLPGVRGRGAAHGARDKTDACLAQPVGDLEHDKIRFQQCETQPQVPAEVSKDVAPSPRVESPQRLVQPVFSVARSPPRHASPPLVSREVREERCPVRKKRTSGRKRRPPRRDSGQGSRRSVDEDSSLREMSPREKRSRCPPLIPLYGDLEAEPKLPDAGSWPPSPPMSIDENGVPSAQWHIAGTVSPPPGEVGDLLVEGIVTARSSPRPGVVVGTVEGTVSSPRGDTNGWNTYPCAGIVQLHSASPNGGSTRHASPRSWARSFHDWMEVDAVSWPQTDITGDIVVTSLQGDYVGEVAFTSSPEKKSPRGQGWWDDNGWWSGDWGSNDQWGSGTWRNNWWAGDDDWGCVGWSNNWWLDEHPQWRDPWECSDVCSLPSVHPSTSCEEQWVQQTPSSSRLFAPQLSPRQEPDSYQSSQKSYPPSQSRQGPSQPPFGPGLAPYTRSQSPCNASEFAQQPLASPHRSGHAAQSPQSPRSHRRPRRLRRHPHPSYSTSPASPSPKSGEAPPAPDMYPQPAPDRAQAPEMLDFVDAGSDYGNAAGNMEYGDPWYDYYYAPRTIMPWSHDPTPELELPDPQRCYVVPAECPDRPMFQFETRRAEQIYAGEDPSQLVWPPRAHGTPIMCPKPNAQAADSFTVPRTLSPSSQPARTRGSPVEHASSVDVPLMKMHEQRGQLSYSNTDTVDNIPRYVPPSPPKVPARPRRGLSTMCDVAGENKEHVQQPPVLDEVPVPKGELNLPRARSQTRLRDQRVAPLRPLPDFDAEDGTDDDEQKLLTSMYAPQRPFYSW